jgi:formylglycine-generating enzyme required for sulfatase activity
MLVSQAVHCSSSLIEPYCENDGALFCFYAVGYQKGKPMKNNFYRSNFLATTLLFVFVCVSPAQTNHGITWILVEGGEIGDYYISATEITFDQFDDFCQATGYQKPEDTFGRGKQPVVNVNVADMIAFCNWLSKETGTTIRLPKEEEFEFAAIGGKKTEYRHFSGSDDPDDVAWFEENSDEKNHEVATKKPNELGIYDMSGNVWEACPASNVLCGGSSYSSPQDCFTSSTREMDDPTAHSAIVGFRVVKQP